MSERLQADRSAWLEANPDDIPYMLGEAQVPAAEYWHEIEQTLGWQGFVLGRRMDEMIAPVRELVEAVIAGWPPPPMSPKKRSRG